MISTQNLCRKVADTRRCKGLTQAEIASRVGVTVQAVSKWERGISCPDIAILDEIADVLGISVSELLGVA